MNIVTGTKLRSNSRKAPHRKSNRSKRQPQGEWLIRGVLPRVGVAMVLGAAGSDIQRQVALHLEGCVQGGEPFGDTPSEQGSVLARVNNAYHYLDGYGDADSPHTALISFMDGGMLAGALKQEGVSTARELAAKYQCCVLIVAEVGKRWSQMGGRIPDVLIHAEAPRAPFAGKITVDGDLARWWLFTQDEMGDVNQVWEVARTGEKA